MSSFLNRSEKLKNDLLNSKPNCYLVCGKPKTGKTSLALKLAQEQKCIYINGGNLVRSHIKLQTEIGTELHENLLSGKHIETQKIIKIIKEKLSAPECFHYGYVLDDFPIFSSTADKNPDVDSIESQLDFLRSHELRPDIIIYPQLADEDLANRISTFLYNPLTGNCMNSKHYTELPVIPPLPKEKFILPLKAPPPNRLNEFMEEAEEEELGNEIEEDIEEEDLEEEEVLNSHPDFPRIPEEELDQYIKLPQSAEDEIIAMLRFFKCHVWQKLMAFMQEVIPLNLINLDANLSPTEIFQTLMANLMNIHIMPANVPIKFYGQKKKTDTNEIVPELFDGKFTSTDTEDVLDELGDNLDGVENHVEEEEEEIPEDLEDEELFKTLSIKQLPAVGYRWRKSCFGRLCPVSLYEGNMVIGRIEFSVGFLGQIYLLANKRNFDLFLKNPRPYLVFPYPKNPVKWAIIGVPNIGLNDIGNILATEESCCVLDMNILIRDQIILRMRNKALEVLKQLTTSHVDESTESFLTKRIREQITDQTLFNVRENLILEKMKNRQPIELIKPDIQVIIDKMIELMESFLSDPIPLDPELYLSALDFGIKQRIRMREDSKPRNKPEGHWIILGLPPHREIWNAIMQRSDYKKQVMEEKVELEKKIEENIKARALRDAKKARAEKMNANKEKNEDLDEENEEAPAEDEDLEEEFDPAIDEEISLPEIPLEVMPDFIFKIKDVSNNYELSISKWYTSSTHDLKDLPSVYDIEQEKLEDLEAESVKSEFVILLEDQIKKKTPADHILVTAALNQLMEFDKDWISSSDLIVGNAFNADGFKVSVEEIEIDSSFNVELISQKIQKLSTKVFNLEAIETTQGDLDAEEEEEIMAMETLLEEQNADKIDDAEEDQIGENNEEDEEDNEQEVVDDEEGDPSTGLKWILGETANICPVTLLEKKVRLAGDPELACKYNGRIYYFANEEAQKKFIEDPEQILKTISSKSFQHPNRRYLILGGAGSGKSLHGYQLAEKLGMYYLKFERQLQNLLWAKMGKNIGQIYQDEVLPPLVQFERLPTASELDAHPNLLEPFSHLLDKQQDKEETQEAEPVKEEEEKEPKDAFNLTDQEEAIRLYLEDGEVIPEEFLENLVGRYWTQEPYLSHGFMLEGFPSSTEQAEWMIEKGFVPDQVYVLDLEAEEAASRLLPRLMLKWQKKMTRIKQNKELRQEHASRLVNIKRTLRRNQLKKEYQERLVLQKKIIEDKRQMMLAENPDMDPEEMEIDEDLEEEPVYNDLIDEEFPQDEGLEEDDEELEEYEDAQERIRGELEESFETVRGKIDDVINYLSEQRIPCRKINVSGNVYRSRLKFINKVEKTVMHFHSLYDRVYLIKWENAKRLLKMGYFPLSKFGFWCPVSMRDDEVRPFLKPILPMGFLKINKKWTNPEPGILHSEKVLSKQLTCAAIYCGEIYWFANKSKMQKFSLEPKKYILNQPGRPMDIVLAVAVRGPPKSGKSTVARSVAIKNKVPRLSGGTVLRWILNSKNHINCSIVKKIQDSLWHGRSVPNALTASVFQIALMQPIASSRGFILDSYLHTDEQWDCFRSRNIMPNLVISLNPPPKSEDLMIRGLRQNIEIVKLKQEQLIRAATGLNPGEDNNDEEEGENKPKINDPIVRFNLPLPETDINRKMTIVMAAYDEVSVSRSKWIEARQGLQMSTDSNQTQWRISRQIDKIISHRMRFLQQYLANKLIGAPAKVGELGLLIENLYENLSEFKTFCPVRFFENGELFDVTLQENTLTSYEVEEASNVLEYNGKFYMLSGLNELDKFIKNPEKYADNRLPDLYPEQITGSVKDTLLLRSDPNSLFAMKGYCPVCFKKGREQYEALQLGSTDFITKYAEKYFTFDTNECRLQFSLRPYDYNELKAPNKLPPLKLPVDIKNLPLPGYLEQTVATAIRKALSAAEQIRPKYPFLDAQNSVYLFMGLHLKSYNPKSSNELKAINRAKLHEFRDDCYLTGTLARTMPIKFNPYLSTTRNLIQDINKLFKLKNEEGPRPWDQYQSSIFERSLNK